MLALFGNPAVLAKMNVTSFVHYRSKMKNFSVSEDGVVIVKKVQGQQSVTVKQKDSDLKFVEYLRRTGNVCNLSIAVRNFSVV